MDHKRRKSRDGRRMERERKRKQREEGEGGRKEEKTKMAEGREKIMGHGRDEQEKRKFSFRDWLKADKKLECSILP